MVHHMYKHIISLLQVIPQKCISPQIQTYRKYPQSVNSHCTISSTMASRGFTLNPLYWLVWQRYEPVISLDTLTIRSTPSQLSICMLPSGMGASLSARDHRMIGLGFPETRHSSSTVSPSRATRGDLPRGTVRLGGTKKEKNKGGTDMGLQKVSRRGKRKQSTWGKLWRKRYGGGSE